MTSLLLRESRLAAMLSALMTLSCSGGATTPVTSPDVGQLLRVGLKLTVITHHGQLPALWPGLSRWDRTEVAAWLDRVINPIYAVANIEIDPTQVTVQRIDRTDAYDLNSPAKVMALETWLETISDPTVLNLCAVNSCSVDGLVGETVDADCTADNSGRTSWVVSLPRIEDQSKDVAHELGHAMSLPHIQSTLPLTAASDNLMSYGTDSVALSRQITRVDPDSSVACFWYQPRTMDQIAVIRQWILANLALRDPG